MLITVLLIKCFLVFFQNKIWRIFSPKKIVKNEEFLLLVSWLRRAKKSLFSCQTAIKNVLNDRNLNKRRKNILPIAKCKFFLGQEGSENLFFFIRFMVNGTGFIPIKLPAKILFRLQIINIFQKQYIFLTSLTHIFFIAFDIK